MTLLNPNDPSEYMKIDAIYAVHMEHLTLLDKQYRMYKDTQHAPDDPVVLEFIQAVMPFIIRVTQLKFLQNLVSYIIQGASLKYYPPVWFYGLCIPSLRNFPVQRHRFMDYVDERYATYRDGGKKEEENNQPTYIAGGVLDPDTIWFVIHEYVKGLLPTEMLDSNDYEDRYIFPAYMMLKSEFMQYFGGTYTPPPYLGIPLPEPRRPQQYAIYYVKGAIEKNIKLLRNPRDTDEYKSLDDYQTILDNLPDVVASARVAWIRLVVKTIAARANHIEYYPPLWFFAWMLPDIYSVQNQSNFDNYVRTQLDMFGFGGPPIPAMKNDADEIWYTVGGYLGGMIPKTYDGLLNPPSFYDTFEILKEKYPQYFDGSYKQPAYTNPLGSPPPPPPANTSSSSSPMLLFMLALVILGLFMLKGRK